MTNANDKRGKKHSGTTSHELVFSTRASHPCEKRNKRNKRRRVRSAQRERERERETNKLRTVTRSVNLKQHVTPDPAALFGFSLQTSHLGFLHPPPSGRCCHPSLPRRTFCHRSRGPRWSWWAFSHHVRRLFFSLSVRLTLGLSFSALACLSSGSKFSVVLLSLSHRLDHVTSLPPYKEEGKPRPVGRPSHTQELLRQCEPQTQPDTRSSLLITKPLLETYN